MPRELAQRTAAPDIPQPGGAVVGAGRKAQIPTGAGQGQSADRMPGVVDGLSLPLGGSVPYNQFACCGGGGRHLDTRGDQTAIIWEGDNPEEDKHITYRQLHAEVCKLANAMKARGVQKGDRVCIYLPMIPEAAVAMLACTRIGAVHSIVFGGFSPDSLRDRIQDSACRLILKAGGAYVPIDPHYPPKRIAYMLEDSGVVLLVTDRSMAPSHLPDIAQVRVDDEGVFAAYSDIPPKVTVRPDDLAYVIYTSGSTGLPKGVVIEHRNVVGYVRAFVPWARLTPADRVLWHGSIAFDLCIEELFPALSIGNGAISLMFEGIPTYPDVSRFWQVVDKHNVATFYTAPTAIRSLMRAGEEPVKKTSRKSLRILGSVGEPINPEAWEWYHNVVGDGRCPIVDTWWQTETGGHLITPLPGATALKPRGRPMYWIGPAGPEQDAGEGTDFHALRTGFVSVTPIQIDLTRHAALPSLGHWLDRLP